MISSKNTLEELCRQNVRTARRRWPDLDKMLVAGLRDLTLKHGFHLQHGHLQLLDGRWYVTHAGLLSLANHRGCAGIEVCPIPKFSIPAENRWAVKATVYTSATCLGFVGFGDAEPSNVSPLVWGAEMRIAETRAVNRALRKAELREASKDQVQEFINHLSEFAANDRDGLLCQLNSYAPKQESAA